MFIPHRLQCLCATILCLVLFPGLLVAQFQIEHWTTERGLPQNSVNAIVQSRTGYLWLGTFGGLVRFDGVSFRVFDRSNTPALSSDRILALVEDIDGTLWLGTESGGVYAFADETMRPPQQPTSLSKLSIQALHVDRLNRVWAGTLTGGVLRIENGVVVDVITTEHGLWSNAITALGEDEDGNLLVATPEGMNLVASSNGTVNRGRPLVGVSVHTMLRRKDRTTWLAGDNLLARWAADARTSLVRDTRFSNQYIRALAEDSDGSLWAGLYPGGLAFIGPDGVQLLGRDHGMNSDLVRSLCLDREGNLWVGSDGGGLHRLRRVPFHVFGAREGLGNEVVLGIAGSRAGGLWLGTNCGGLYHLHHGRLRHYTERDGLTSDCVWSVNEQRDGSLWIGTWTGAVSRMQGGTFIPNRDGETIPVFSTLAILHDSHGRSWFGTTTRGVAVLERGTLTYLDTTHGLAGNDVRSFFEDTDGSIWIGTLHGISRWKDGSITSYGKEDGLQVEYIRSIHRDREGSLWVGTYGGGLAAFQRGKFMTIDRRAGLFDNIISTILEDDLGHLWMSCNRGIFRVSKAELREYVRGDRDNVRSYSYGIEDGLRSTESNGGFYPSGVRLNDGTLAFPTIKGVAFLNPSVVTTNDVLPPVVIEQVLVDQASMPLTASVELPHTSSYFEFRFTGLSFIAPHKVRFQYRMEGYDDTWIDAETRRVAYYTGLRPGAYRFLVKAANNDGVWNPEPAVYAFVILTPFWMTPWFLTLSVLMVAGSAYGLFRWRIRELEHEREQERRFAESLKNSEHEYRTLFERFRSLVENINDVYYVVDPGGSVTYASPNFYSMSGFGPDEVIGHSYAKFISRDDRRWVVKHYQNVTQDGTVDTSCICRIGRKDGSRLWVEQTTRILRDDRGWVMEYRNIVRDISERRRAQELQEEFARELLDSQERERKRISGELHDSLGQNLLIIKNRALLALHENDGEQALRDQLQEISGLASQTIDEVRAISYNLRPYQLDRLGLKKAIDSMVKKLAESSNIAIVSKVENISALLPKEHDINVFRIVQEALSNVVKHSQATEAKVVVAASGRTVTVTVEDNGKGMKRRAASPDSVGASQGEAGSRGFGLIGIAERARIMGGTLQIQSSKDEGTTLTIQINVPEPPNGFRA